MELNILNVKVKNGRCFHVLLLIGLWYLTTIAIPAQYGLITPERKKPADLIDANVKLEGQITKRSEQFWFLFKNVDRGIEEYSAVFRLVSGPEELSRVPTLILRGSALVVLAFSLYSIIMFANLVGFDLQSDPKSKYIYFVYYSVLVAVVFNCLLIGGISVNDFLSFLTMFA